MLKNKYEVDDIEICNALESGEWDYIKYAIAFEKNLRNLEAHLHNAEDPELIARDALVAGAEFYDGDWCGVIQADLVMHAWQPLWWHNRYSQDMSDSRFNEIEEAEALDRWVEALHKCEPVIIPDTSILKDTNPFEYEVYERLGANSILAVPFWKNPTGFMIVRNPKKHINHSSYLQMLAYVAFSSVTEKKLMDRSKKTFTPERIKNDNDVMVNLFGNLEIYSSKGMLKEDEISSPRICRLLTYLILHKSQPQAPRTIYDAIWPEEEIDNAGSKIKALVFRLQSAFSIISDYRLIVSTPHGYQLNPELNIMTDIDLFEQCYMQAQSALSSLAKVELLKQTVELYKGGLLASASGEHWLLSDELAYKYKYVGSINELLRLFYEHDNYVSVQLCASKALGIDKYNVDVYHWLIRSMRKSGSPEMANGELKMAEQLLTKEEYELLMKKLEKDI